MEIERKVFKEEGAERCCQPDETKRNEMNKALMRYKACLSRLVMQKKY